MKFESKVFVSHKTPVQDPPQRLGGQEALASPFLSPQSSTSLLIKMEFSLVAQLVVDSKFLQRGVIEIFNPPMFATPFQCEE